MTNPSQELLVGPPLYLLAETADGNEEFIFSTNIKDFAYKMAESFAMEMSESCRIIDGATHVALCRYEAGRGLEADWRESDPHLAASRKKHIRKGLCTPLPGCRIIRYKQCP